MRDLRQQAPSLPGHHRPHSGILFSRFVHDILQSIRGGHFSTNLSSQSGKTFCEDGNRDGCTRNHFHLRDHIRFPTSKPFRLPSASLETPPVLSALVAIAPPRLTARAHCCRLHFTRRSPLRQFVWQVNATDRERARPACDSKMSPQNTPAAVRTSRCLRNWKKPCRK